LLLLTGALAVEPVTVAVPGLVAVVLGPVTAVVLGPDIMAVVGPVAAVVLGPVIVALGVATVALFGGAADAGFTTAGVFSARVMVSLTSAIRGGGIIRVIPIILIHLRTTATAIPTMATRTMATLTTVIRTETVILARPLPRPSKPHSHEGATITVRLTVRWVRRLAMQFDRFRPIKVYR
jgi:hypothetical protein